MDPEEHEGEGGSVMLFSEDKTKERTITVTLTEMEFGALAGAISKAMEHWHKHEPNPAANWMNEMIAKGWEKLLAEWFPTKSPRQMREGYDTMFGPIPKSIQEKVNAALNVEDNVEDGEMASVTQIHPR